MLARPPQRRTCGGGAVGACPPPRDDAATPARPASRDAARASPDARRRHAQRRAASAAAVDRAHAGHAGAVRHLPVLGAGRPGMGRRAIPRGAGAAHAQAAGPSPIALSPGRTVPDREVVGLQLRGSARVAAHLRARDARPDAAWSGGKAWRERFGRLCGHRLGVPPVGRHRRRSPADHRWGAALRSVPAVRRQPAPPAALVHERVEPAGRGWRSSIAHRSGAHRRAPARSPLFHMGLLHTVGVVGAIVVGAAGMWRLSAAFEHHPIAPRQPRSSMRRFRCATSSSRPVAGVRSPSRRRCRGASTSPAVPPVSNPAPPPRKASAPSMSGAAACCACSPPAVWWRRSRRRSPPRTR